MEWGLAIGLFAAAIAAILPGMGSAKAVGLAGETAAGVSAETPEAYCTYKTRTAYQN